jgi:hypothetical protein
MRATALVADQSPRFISAFLPPGELMEHLSQIPPVLLEEHLPAALRDEHHVAFALPLRVA